MNTQVIAKNVVAWVTVLATLAWTAGLALMPIQAEAAMPQAPALVKASGAAVYFYATDGKRYVFPNEKTFKTWYQDFSKVSTITDEELASLPIGGNVVYRSGTRLVKITTDPKVYAVEPGGKLRHVGTEEVAKGLFGDNWSQRVDDVADAFFTNYTTGEPINSVTPPAGSVVSDGTNTFYITKDAEKRKLTGTAMEDNWFRANYVLNLEASVVSGMSNGSDLNSKLDNLTDVAQLSSGGSTGPIAVSGKVEVKLSSTGNPIAGNSLPSGAFYAPMLCMDVMNGTNAELKVVGMTVKRFGILADSSVTGILVTDSDGILHGSNVTFGESTASSRFGSEPIYVQVGKTEQVCINVNISAAVNTGTIGLKMNVSDLLLESSSGATVVAEGGSTVLSGPIQQIVAGAGALGEVQVSSRAIGGATAATATEVDQGAKDIDVAKFRFQEITGNEAVEMKNVTFQNNGSASDKDVENIRLVDQTGKVIAQADRMNNNEIKFAFKGLAEMGVESDKIGPEGGYLIPEGQLRDLTLRIDTAVNTNSANRTLIFTLQEANDIRILGTETGVGVTPSETPGAVAPDVFPIGDDFNAIKFRQGNVSFSRSTSSTAGKVARGTTDLQLAAFDMNGFGEDVELQDIDFVIRKTAAAGLAEDGFALSGTVTIENKNGASIFSTTGTSAALYGTACDTGAISVALNKIVCAGGVGVANGTATRQTLNTFYTIPAGTVGQIRFVGDIHQNATAADQYTVVITGFRLRRISSNNFDTQTGLAIAGNTLSVDASTITALSNPGFNPVNLVRGGGDQHVASFNLQVGSSEANRVNSITVRACESANNVIEGVADCDSTLAAELNAVSNLKLMVDGVAIAPPFTISATTGFTVSTDLLIPKNETKVVDVYAIVSTAFPQTFFGIGFDVNSAVGVDSQTATDLAEVFSTGLAVTNAGALVVPLITDGSINIPKLLHTGAQEPVPLSLFQMDETNNAENIILEHVYFGGKGLNNFKSFMLLKLGQQPIPVGNVATSFNNEVRFTGLNELIVTATGGNTYMFMGIPLDAGQINVVNNTGFFSPTYVEYYGTVSGNRVIDSGGLTAATGTSAGNDTVGINDGANFEESDQVFVDWNNDGDYIDVFGGDNINENIPMKVCTIDTVNKTIQFFLGNDCQAGALVDITAITNFVAGGRLASLPLTSASFTVEETEPIMAVHSNFIDNSQTLDAQVGTFVFAAKGSRPINIDRLRFEISGSYQLNTAGGAIFGPKNFQLWRAGDDGRKSIQITAATPVLSFVPSGALDADLTAGFAANATSVTFDGGTAARLFQVGDRITFNTTNCAGAEKAANGSMGYRVTFATQATTGTLTFTPGLRAALLNNDVVCPLSDQEKTVAGVEAIGQTVITLNNTTGVEVGNLVSFTDIATPLLSNNNNQGYRVLAAAGNDITITPGLEAALAANDLARFGSIALAVTDVPESGTVIAFDLPAGEQIGVNSSSYYSLVADTSNIKDPGNTGTATISVRIPGVTGTASNANGLHWTYTTTTGIVRPVLDIANFYPINSQTLAY